MSMQRKFEFIEAKIDCNRNYSLKDTFKFELKMLFHEPVEEDLVFEIIYFIYKDKRTIEDYSLGKFKISSAKRGEVTFDLESSLIDISKIPIRTLFGLTSFLLSGRYQDKEFVRVGYVVNVGYQGLSDRELDAINEKENSEESEGDMVDDVEDEEEDEVEEKEEDEMIENSNEEEENEEYNNEEDSDYDGEDEDDGEDEVDGEDEDDGEDGDENDCADCDEEKDNEEGDEEKDNEEGGDKANVGNEEEEQIEEMYIDPNVDEFEFADKKMKQSCIELKLLENPIIQLFDIDGIDNPKVVDAEEEELVESSDTDVSENDKHKKPKLNE